MVTRWDVTRAVRRSNLPAPARLIMFVLADVADNNTAVIPADRSPSLTILADETGLGRSTVARELNRLEEEKWVLRDRPDIVKARSTKARTKYRLDIPAEARDGLDQEPVTSPAAGLVPERDQSLVPERDQVGPRAGLELVPERDQVGPRAGLELVPERDWASPAAGHISTPLTSSKPSNPSSGAGATTKTRGTRIPDEFKVTPEMVEWARANTPNVDGRRETERFIDYWRSAAGAKGVKTDWTATWRNWMRKAQDDAQPANPHRTPTGRPLLPASNAPTAIPTAERCPDHRGEHKGACRHCRAIAIGRKEH